jgi:hypothetical protein
VGANHYILLRHNHLQSHSQQKIVEVMARQPKQCQDRWLSSTQYSAMVEDTDKYANVRQGIEAARQQHGFVGIPKQIFALVSCFFCGIEPQGGSATR